MAFEVRYTPIALDHLRKLAARDQTIVVDAVENQLRDQPEVATRNRKPLRANELATWELRLDDLRVFYQVEPNEASEAAEQVSRTSGNVIIVAVGVKRGNRLLIGGNEFEL